jgi:hypothetical protein
MWLAAVSLMVVVATGDPSDGSTRAIEQALHAALGNGVVIVVRTATTERDAADAVAEAAANDGAAFVGVVAWSDHQERVSIHFTNPPDGRRTDREIRFDSADDPAERWRTVGFALASMMPQEAGAPPSTTILPVTPPALVDAPAAPAPAREATPTLRRPNGLALDASAVATTAVSGYGGGIGGTFALRLPLVGALGGRVAMGARAGEVAPAQATSRVLSGAVGVTWQPWLDTRQRWAVGARVDALLLHHHLSHLSADDPDPVSLSRFVPGVDAALEGAWRFADRALIVAAFGSEAALGRTDVFVQGREVASLPPVRLFSEAGIRVSF